MSTTPNTARRGMTLVELLVVVIILGLLGVATLPTINSSGPKRRLRDAAAAVETHLNQAVSKAVGSRSGQGAWLQPDGTAGTSPTTTLSFCGGSTEAAGTATLTLTSATAAQCAVSLSPPQATTPSGCLIRFAGFPYEYTLSSVTTVTLSGMAAASSMLWPAASNGTYSGTIALPFTLSIPPGKASGGKTVLGGNTCVDLPSSTIGVTNYSNTVENPSNASPLIITYDSLGRAKSVVYTNAGDALGVKQRRLDSRMPIAFLVGLRDQVAATQVSVPSEDNPGTNWQRSDTWWVVVDPRTSTTFRVENVSNAISLTAAQRFIRQALLNDSNAQ
jgi:prepilin-type N-terminal cleavage/methylation domain-containing protein